MTHTAKMKHAAKPPGHIFRVAGRILILLSMLAAPAPRARAELSAWRVDPQASEIVFVFSQLGAPIEGRFAVFDADIRFDTDRPEIAVSVAIDTASLDTGDSDRDQQARGPLFFAVEAHPRAVFEAGEVTGAAGRYEARGTLTIKGITRPAALPFTLEIDGDRARAQGELSLDRQAFGIGTGDWASNGAIGDDVTIRVSVTATRAP